MRYNFYFPFFLKGRHRLPLLRKLDLRFVFEGKNKFISIKTIAVEFIFSSSPIFCSRMTQKIVNYLKSTLPRPCFRLHIAPRSTFRKQPWRGGFHPSALRTADLGREATANFTLGKQSVYTSRPKCLHFMDKVSTLRLRSVDTEAPSHTPPQSISTTPG